MRLADANNPAVRGLKVNEAYYLHRIAQGSSGMIHLTSDRGMQMALLGDNVKFRGPFTLPVGTDFTVHVPGGGEEAAITRIVKVKGILEEKKLSCPPDVSAVLTAMGTLGGGYSEAVELIRRADRARSSPRQWSSTRSRPNSVSGNSPSSPTATRALEKANAEVAKVGVVRPELDATGFNLPSTDADAATRPPTPPPAPPLNREPGRIFGPKRHDVPAIDPGVIPAGDSNRETGGVTA